VPSDLAVPNDVAVPADQAMASDLAVADLATPNDLTPPPDLALPPDLTPPPDLAIPPDLTPPSDFARCTQIKINEVQTGSLNLADDEFIEIYNACNTSVDLTSYKLVYRTTNNVESTFVTFNGQFLLQGGFMVVAHTNFAGMANVRYGPNVSMSAVGAGIGLRDTQGNLLDSVAWGTLMVPNSFTETNPTVAPAKSKSIQRLPDGNDTNDNSKDFAEGTGTTPGAPNQP
jgi:hypothetical protein